MSVSFNGFKNKVLTFENGGVLVGYPVVLDKNGKAINASTGSEFIGICTAVNGDYASVQTDGYVEAKYSSNSVPLYGISGFTAASLGKILPADATAKANSYLVVKVDEANEIVGFIL
ncbi:MAG: hypothetical protein ACLUFN_02660 [Eubacterium sp.]